MMMAVIYFSDQLNFFERGLISSISEKLVKEGYADGIAEELAKGHIVTNVSGCDDRLLQRQFISKMKKCPNTIVLGSSRVRFINGNMVHDTSLINSGVSSASLEDLVAIYSLYEKRGCEIKEVIIGVDPWILNDNNDLNSWRTLESQYYNTCNELFNSSKPTYPYLKPTPLRNLKALFSYKYFTSSIQYLRKNIEKGYRITNKKENEGLTILPNGTFIYSEKIRNSTQDFIDMKAKRMAETDEGNSLSNYSKLSERYTAIFTKFIEHIQSKKIKVTFYFPPFHPIVYHTIETQEKYKIALEAQSYFKKFAAVHQIEAIGDYDPKANDLTSKDFADGVHLYENGVAAIFRQGQ